MTHGTDRMLQPGERVIHRDPRSRRLFFPPIAIATLGVAVTVAFVLDWMLSGITTPSLVTGASIVLAALGASVWMAIFVRRNALIVTDRRVIHRSGWWKVVINAIPLDDIRELVRRPVSGLEIRSKDDLEIVDMFGRRPAALAEILARAAGVAPPGFPDRKERLVQVVVDIFNVFAYVISILFALVMIALKPDFLGVLGSLSWVVGWVAAGCISWLAISLLGWVIIVAAACSFMNAEEMRDSLCRDADVNRLNRNFVEFLLRVASLIYQRPIRCEGSGDK